MLSKPGSRPQQIPFAAHPTRSPKVPHPLLGRPQQTDRHQSRECVTKPELSMGFPVGVGGWEGDGVI